MKNRNFLAVVSFIIFCLSLFTCLAAANDTLISFSTPGPDTYLDGTTVLDGECYALVWTKTGATFEGLTADGAAVGTNSTVLVYAPVAKKGRCPTVVFELDADLAKKYEGGSFGVYLLDTRLASGKVGGLNANGRPVAVNGYGAASGAVAGGQGQADLSAGTTGGQGRAALPVDDSDGVVGRGVLSAPQISVTTKSALPANAPKPQITSIRVVGANVVLTVKNTLPCLQYAAREVKMTTVQSNNQTIEQSNNSSPIQGASSTDEEITVIVPKKGESGFFQVSRP